MSSPDQSNDPPSKQAALNGRVSSSSGSVSSSGNDSQKPHSEHPAKHPTEDPFISVSKLASHEDLPAILLAKHIELDRLLEELNEISIALRSKDSPDIQGLSESLLRAVRGAVRQSLLDRELCSLALIDDLTGLHNRRGFLALAGQQLKQGLRNLQEVLLFSADVDNLKTINDSYGHQEGDTALMRTATALRRTFRNSDIVARFGGDEFCALALEASIENERSIIKRLQHNLNQANGPEPRYALVLSVGTARFNPRKPVTLEQLMEQADRAMYQVKKSRPGRAVASPVSG
jgi:diguanylate cyclase (GGDEF)-like protein